MYLLEFLNLVPKNRVVTYKFLSKIFLIHPRQVGKILSKNIDIDGYNCYKVIHSNGKVGGYIGGVNEKVRRLEQDGIKILEGGIIPDEFVWNPKISHFFLAFRLDDINKGLFSFLINVLESSFGKYGISYQNINSSHITLRFLGNISLEKYQEIVLKTIEFLKKNKFMLKTHMDFKFKSTGNFRESVYFFCSEQKENVKILKKFYKLYSKHIGYDIEERGYYPHLTVLKLKNDKSKFDKNLFKQLTSNYSFNVKIKDLTFYAGFDGKFQIPLYDLEI